MITEIQGIPIRVDPFCPADKIFIISGESPAAIINLKVWEDHFWDDIWGTGLRPARWHLLPRF